MRFEELGLIEPLLRAVSTQGYEKTTPIQAKAIPHILDGKDVLGCAQTGTGKTAAFALPILHRVDREPVILNNKRKRKDPPREIRTLVLAPTRELAQQIHDSFRTYGKFTGTKQTVIFGGVNQNTQARTLRKGVDVLVATPGRLLDLLGQGLLRLDHVEILVLDEADRMLDMGFLPDIRKVISRIPEKRQTLLFSATLPEPIRELAGDILNEPVSVRVASEKSVAAPTVKHMVYHVDKSNKPELLTSFLDHTPYSRVLVFTKTKYGADKVTHRLEKSGLNAVALHGNKTQNARTRALASFRSARTPILVATDIAARGLDVEDISHVINYDLTHEPETYVHRIGRTGRAGETGTAISFCSREEQNLLRITEHLLKLELETGETPSGYTATFLTPPARDKQNGRSKASNNSSPTGNPRKNSNSKPNNRSKSNNSPRPNGSFKRSDSSKPNSKPNPNSSSKRNNSTQLDTSSKTNDSSKSNNRPGPNGSFKRSSSSRPNSKPNFNGGVKRNYSTQLDTSSKTNDSSKPDSDSKRNGVSRSNNSPKFAGRVKSNNSSKRNSRPKLNTRSKQNSNRRPDDSPTQRNNSRQADSWKSNNSPSGKPRSERTSSSRSNRSSDHPENRSGDQAESSSNNRRGNRTNNRPDNRANNRSDNRSNNNSDSRTNNRSDNRTSNRPGNHNKRLASANSNEKTNRLRRKLKKGRTRQPVAS